MKTFFQLESLNAAEETFGTKMEPLIMTKVFTV